MTTEQQRAELLALAEKATPGPWKCLEADEQGPINMSICRNVADDGYDMTLEASDDDEKYILAACNLAPVLAREVDALRRLVSEMYPFVLVHCTSWSAQHGLEFGKYHPTHQRVLEAAKAVYEETEL